MSIVDSLFGRIGDLPPGYLLLAAAAVLAAEVGLLAGVVLPAATTMLTVGLLARDGHLDLGVVLLVTTLAAFTGDQLGYLEGRLLGPRVRDGWLGRRIGADRWRRAERLIAERGGPAVLLGRWTAFARTLVPRLAGAAGLSYRRFVLFDGAAVVVWVPGTVLLGWAVGGVPTGLPAAGGVGLVAVVIVVIVLSRRARRAGGGPARPPGPPDPPVRIGEVSDQAVRAGGATPRTRAEPFHGRCVVGTAIFRDRAALRRRPGAGRTGPVRRGAGRRRDG
ncbi:DedA family protein [Micromonospora endolithica]|uniref:DedA family protein n=1 Tax=Micromonospora endolithica TaxID=230091 RepID=A0A3A9Z1Q2_9ACTN|nr:DedA family protein [Micromonospora endolithica]RKN41989.1 DedA family protein [Micromonospora endolithica]TWJ26218.1 membrane protein DedA with SNARE-associated domain [Micromonospora endolithica]